MKNLDSITREICRDLLAYPIPALLSRDDFVARYMPQYRSPYELPSGLRLRRDGRPVKPTRATHDAQVTKRNNLIEAAYAKYAELHKSQAEFDARTGVS